MRIKLRLNQMEEVEDLRNEYPYAYHHVDLRTTDVPWHWHEALELCYVFQGSMKVSTPVRTLTFTQGQGFFINSNVLASMDSPEGCIMDSHLFHPVLLGGHFKSVFETKYIEPVLQNKNVELIPLWGDSAVQNTLLQKLRQLSALQSKADAEFQTRNLLSDIWLLLLEELKNSEITQPVRHVNQERIQTMMAFIQENYTQKLTLEEIAASAAISTRECLRCFRICIHLSPIDYLIECRVQAAKKLLENTRLSVSRIAMDTGFNSNAYFSKIFKRSTGLTPIEYRKAQAEKA